MLLAIARPEPSAEPLVVTGFEPGQLVSLQDSRLHLVKDSPVRPARGPRCSQDPGPCASSPGKQVVRKYNLAARCGDRPIFARYRPPRNQRAPARCDNRRSHSQRKRARPIGPFLIAALDRCLCPPHQIEDWCPICQLGITVNPTQENANVPKIPRKRGASPFICALQLPPL